MVCDEGRDAIAIAGDASLQAFADEALELTLRTFGKLDILVRYASSPKLLVALTHGTLGQPCGHPDSAGLSVRHHAQAAARDVQDECILHVLLHASGAAAPGGPRLHHQQCVSRL